MYYTCKVLTPEFTRRVNKYIDMAVETEVAMNSGDPSRLPFLKLFKKREMRDSLDYYWNHPNEFSLEMNYYLAEHGIAEPEYQEMLFLKMDHGFQSYARIEWRGSVVKVDDVFEIFSYAKAPSYPVPVRIR